MVAGKVQPPQDPAYSASATRALASFCAATRAADVSAGARRKALLGVLDCIGVMLAAGGEGSAELPAAVLSTIEGPGTASLIGVHGRRLSPPSAALANGARAHALDFDDVHYPWYGHPTAVLFPALFALAQHFDVGGERLITAYAVGLKLGSVLAEALNMDHYTRGWHATATFGSIAAAGACANLMGLSADQAAHALGIAASAASGVRQNFGSHVKPLHAGFAARNGVLAALFAQAGMCADAAALEGNFGFAAVFGSRADAEHLDQVADLLDAGIDRAFDGLTLKLYPSCAATHPALDAMLDLVRKHDIDPHLVVQVDCDVPSLLQEILVWTTARSGLQGKFSLEYCMAIALLDRVAGLAQFTDARAADPELWAMMERVRQRADPDVDPRGEFGTRVAIRLSTGGGYSQYAPCARGTPSVPVTDEDVIAKFETCAALQLGPADVQRVLAAVLDLDTERSVRELALALDAA